MASFPPEWLIYRAEDFATFQLAPLADAGTTMQTMVLLNPDGSASGNFRVGLAGRDHISAHFKLSQVLADPPPNLAEVVLTYSAALEDVTPPINATSTAWTDLEKLLRDRSVLPGPGKEQSAMLKLLIGYLSSLDKNKPGVGSSLRWAVAGSAALGGLQLELQALPSPAKLLTKNNLKGDNAVSVVISSTQMQTELFDGISHAGPVPMFFATDRRVARAALSDDPDAAHQAIREVNNRFLYPEHLTLGEAVAYLQASKARAAKGSPVFAAVPSPAGRALTTGGRKRARLSVQQSQQETEETGTTRSFSNYAVHSYVYRYYNCTSVWNRYPSYMTCTYKLAI